ncbi:MULTISPECIES: DNA cytosine methyltransferase [unclassified Streptomyces]|uniref:DNA (cytosine-5-)-methyltransferase n=2 Tax=unclassified Streptomyces TaxID=2593676 RepID=A0A6G3QXM5_9ACTN|nr:MULTISPECIES: DNA cytosine methyltransferase [unclassified Streptomyces]NEA88253.1 DNA cytosine methyltransferase [Streptomyces sp. SID14436]NEC81681.1 DNA cytosine methyltransferase [Streptomyces sp. SID7958]
MTSTPPHRSILDKPFVLDLFAGPGGLDVAGHKLGLPSLGIEWDRSACLTRYAAGLDTLHADVSAVRRESFESLPPEINVLAGGPPCQTYSVAGRGAGRKALEEVKGYIKRLMAGDPDTAIDKELRKLSDPRTALVLEPLRYAIQATRSPNRGHRPYDVIVLEQVPSVVALWEGYAEVLQEVGLPDGTKYQVAVDVLKTESYGVPQTRSRAVLIARREALGKPSLPAPTHRAYEAKGWNRRNGGIATATTQPTLYDVDVPEPRPRPTEDDGLDHWTSMGDALAEPVGTHPGRRTPFLIRSNYGSSGNPGRRGVRTDLQPATTVTGRISRFVVFEPVGDHHLDVLREGPRFSMNEAGMLQSFPPDYPWSGNAQAQQVGNAVPPLFGAHLLSAALGLPAPAPETMREPWVPATEEQRAKLRSHGCGAADDCTARCPRPE